jgi:hypothetical protein
MCQWVMKPLLLLLLLRLFKRKAVRTRAKRQPVMLSILLLPRPPKANWRSEFAQGGGGAQSMPLLMPLPQTPRRRDACVWGRR